MEDIIPLFDNDDYLAIEQLDFPNSLKANLSPKIMATKILKINDLKRKTDLTEPANAYLRRRNAFCIVANIFKCMIGKNRFWILLKIFIAKLNQCHAKFFN